LFVLLGLFSWFCGLKTHYIDMKRIYEKRKTTNDLLWILNTRLRLPFMLVYIGIMAVGVFLYAGSWIVLGTGMLIIGALVGVAYFLASFVAFLHLLRTHPDSLTVVTETITYYE